MAQAIKYGANGLMQTQWSDQGNACYRCGRGIFSSTRYFHLPPGRYRRKFPSISAGKGSGIA